MVCYFQKLDYSIDHNNTIHRISYDSNNKEIYFQHAYFQGKIIYW